MPFLAADTQSTTTTIIMIVVLVVIVVAMLVIPMFTNKKKQKEVNEMHSKVVPGAVIKTIGGIIGTVVEIRQTSAVDREMVIETGIGDNKTTMVFDMQALYQIVTPVDAPAPINEGENVENNVPEVGVADVPDSSEIFAPADANADKAVEETVEDKVAEEKVEEKPVVEEESKQETLTDETVATNSEEVKKAVVKPHTASAPRKKQTKK